MKPFYELITIQHGDNRSIFLIYLIVKYKPEKI